MIATSACVTGLKQTLNGAASAICGNHSTGHRSWSAQLCACRARPTVNSLTQGCLNSNASPHARHQSKPALFEAGVGARKRCSASSIKTRIFRDFSGSGELGLAAQEFSYFRKPLHFNRKYAYIE
jgi:hypothetical protein